MRVKEIYDYIDSFAPFSSKADWDNSGFLVGDIDADVKKAVICLDVTADVITFAVKENASLLISHHPVIFKAQKNFTAGNPAFTAAKYGISIISAHTNLDKAADGVNDTLCKALDITYEKLDESVCEGFLNVGEFSENMSPAAAAAFISKKLGGAVNYCEGSTPIKKLGICSGSGADFIDEAVKLGCNAFITGDASYHDFLDAKAEGISLFAAGHFETEVLIVKALAEKLRNKFNFTEFIEYISVSPVITEK